VSLFLLIVLNC